MSVNISHTSESLGERMKTYEKNSLKVVNIEPWNCFLVRLDGCSFSTKLKTLKTACGKKKSFYSTEFHDAMKQTASDILFSDWRPSTVYSHSDEITILIAAVCTKEEYDAEPTKFCHLYRGRVTKILSLLASFTSIRFNFHFNNFLLESKPEFAAKYFSSGPCFSFDARIITFESELSYEFVNHMVWRSKHDCYRNFVGMIYDRMFPHTHIFSLNTLKRKERLKTIDIDIESFDVTMKYGMYLKRPEHNTGRNRIPVVFAMPDIKCTDAYQNFLFSKHFDMSILADNSDLYIVFKN